MQEKNYHLYNKQHSSAKDLTSTSMDSKGRAAVESKSRRRSMSSFSGYLNDLSQEHTSSSSQFPQSSTFSASEELTRGKTGSIYKSQRRGGWMSSWRWSRMRRNYRRKTVAVVSRRPSTSKRKSTAGNTTDEAVVTSEDHSNKETNHVNLGKRVIPDVKMDELIVRYTGEQSSRDRIRRNVKESYLAVSLSLKYQPKCFQDIVGHETIIRAMINTIHKNKVVSLYLFHGPIGTGKSSTARILAMALNCEADPNCRPCWNCRECLRSLYVMDMCSGSRSSGFEKIKTLIQSTSFTHTLAGYKVFIILECHLLTPEAWNELLGMIEGLHSSSIVFILITMDVNVLPVTVSSRSQKYFFSKLKDWDIKKKLESIAVQEGISIEPEAMQLITTKADGSLCEAVNILDQLTLLGARITTPIVQEIVCLVPQEKLKDLLTAALAGESVKTIKYATELLRTGIEVQSLVSQLATLIKDVLSHDDVTISGSSFLVMSENGQSERLCRALKVLLSAEKKSKSSSDQSTRLFAALLQIAPQDSSSRTSPRVAKPDKASLLSAKCDEPSRESVVERQHTKSHKKQFRHDQPSKNSHKQGKNVDSSTLMTIQEEKGIDGKIFTEKKPELAPISGIDEIWLKIVERVQDRKIQEFLSSQVKLGSLTISSANAIAHLIFRSLQDRKTAEMSEESIVKALQEAVGCPFTVNMSQEPLNLRMMESEGQPNMKQPGESSDFRKQPKTSIHPADIYSPSQGHLNYSRLSQILTPLPQDDANNTSTTSLMQYRSSAEEKKETTPLSHWIPSFQQHQSPELRTNASVELGMNHQQSLVDASHITKNKNRRRPHLSLSFVPQSEASIEPYSQDILYERTNINNQTRARRESVLKKGGLNGQDEQPSSIEAAIGKFQRTWSCRELFCHPHF